MTVAEAAPRDETASGDATRTNDRPRRPTLLCRPCGNFVPAVDREGALEPLRSPCPRCGATAFRDIYAD